MNPRSVINFFKSPPGAFLGFCVILGVIFYGVKRYLPGATKPHPLVYSTKAAATAASKETLETYQNTNYAPVKIPAPPVMPTPNHASRANSPSSPRREISVKRVVVKASPKPEILPISLFSETPKTKPKPLSKDYAPYGRLIPCELIVTVDSSSIQTPIIGLVTEDVYFGGRLLIPAGTEVHGKAQTDRKRDRIASSGGWTLVWQDGRELRVSGIALDREFDPDGTGWGITDGSAGLRGEVLRSDDMAEIKLFAASFLSAAASAFTENQQTIYGTQVLPTAKNAGLEGAQSVIQAYAQQIYDSIQRDGVFIRVPAGKQFYLYVTQTIDISDATVGGTRFQPNEFAPQTNQTSNPLAPYLSPAAAAYLNRASP
jgi:Bacterial conjugation TrbI-like protein